MNIFMEHISVTFVVEAFFSPQRTRCLGEDWWIHSRLSFLFCFVFCFWWRSARAHRFHSLSQDQFTVAQRTWATVAECSLTSCVWARFPPTLGLCRDSMVRPIRLRCVEGVYMFRCNLPPALLAKWPGSLTCYCGDTSAERAPKKSQHRKFTQEKKIFPPAQVWSYSTKQR